MNCQLVQEELLEQLGLQTLPQHLADHVANCDECRDLWIELKQLPQRLGTDETFYLDDSEINELTEGVMQKIESSTSTVITPLYRVAQMVLPVAASLLLLFGVSKLPDRPVADRSSSDFAIADIFEEDGYFGVFDETDDMDDITIELLVSDFAFGDIVTPGEALLDDLTDEELDYLKINMDMGELL